MPFLSRGVAGPPHAVRGSAPRWSSITLVLAAAVLAAWLVPTGARADSTLQGELLSPPGVAAKAHPHHHGRRHLGVKAIRDRRATNHRALRVASGRMVSGSIAVPDDSIGLDISARGVRCAGPPRMVAYVDGQRVLNIRVRSRRYEAYSADVDLPAGTHTLSIVLANHYHRAHHCARNLVIDALTLRSARGGTSRGQVQTVTPPPAPAPPPPPPPPPGVTKMMVFIEENHSLNEMKSQMPSLFSLATTHGYTMSYTAAAHPSLPNYLAIAGGTTYGVKDDNPPSSHKIPGQSIFDQAIAAGRTAKLYAETMTANCQQNDAGNYAVKHNPWAYYSDAASRADCMANDVPLGTPSAGALHDDMAAGRIPNVSMVVPNLVDDAHDASLGAADTWLKGWLDPLMATPDYQAGRLLIVVTADEDDGSQGNKVLTVLLHPSLTGAVPTAPLNHYSLTRAAAELVHATPLNGGATATSLLSAFGLTVGA